MNNIKRPETSRFLQSPDMREAQQRLWEASLSHNHLDTAHLSTALWHIERELKHRRSLAQLQNGTRTLDEVLSDTPHTFPVPAPTPTNSFIPAEEEPKCRELPE